MENDPDTLPAKRRTWTPEEVNRVRQVRDTLSATVSECYNAPGDDCGKCDQCVMAQMIDELSAVVDPPDLPVQRYRDRLTYNGGINGEAFLLACWHDEQRRTKSHARGITILEHVLGERPTFRDAEVAASLITWFGTNIGRGFLDNMVGALQRCDAAAKLKRDRENREAMEQRRPKPRDEEPPADAKWFVVDWNETGREEGDPFTHLSPPCDTAKEAGRVRRTMETNASDRQLEAWNLAVVWEVPPTPILPTDGK